MSSAQVTPARQAAVNCLSALANELAASGFACQIVVPRGAPAYGRVVNMSAKALKDDIACFSAEGDKELYFWWSWGERIAPATEMHSVAQKIAYVLTPSGM